MRWAAHPIQAAEAFQLALPSCRLCLMGFDGLHTRLRHFSKRLQLLLQRFFALFRLGKLGVQLGDLVVSRAELALQLLRPFTVTGGKVRGIGVSTLPGRIQFLAKPLNGGLGILVAVNGIVGCAASIRKFSCVCFLRLAKGVPRVICLTCGLA